MFYTLIEVFGERPFFFARPKGVNIMNMKIESLAVRLYEEGLRKGDADKIRQMPDMDSETADKIVSYLAYYEQLEHEEH